jgi:uncharacterized protein (TIGR03118 family)
MSPKSTRLRNRTVYSRGSRARRALLLAATATALVGLTNNLPAQFYQKTYLVSDVSGRATYTDPNLVGAWGVARSATSPWWVNSTMGGTSLLFNGSGQAFPTAAPLVVTIPGPPMGPANHSIPTGIVFNSTSEFTVGPSEPAAFIFVTRNGTIAGWNHTANAAMAITRVDNSAAADYTGAALVTSGSAPVLYVANFGQAQIEAYDGSFKPVTLAAGAFADARIPAHYAPFNIQLVGNRLYVTYAPATTFTAATGAGEGRIDVFDLNGRLQRRLRHGKWMNAPWGVTQAPADFGRLSNDILVGMFGDGTIAAFNAASGEFRGRMRTAAGKPLIIAKGLWGLEFGNGANAGPANTLYFASDMVTSTGEFHGVFGSIVPLPASADGDDQGPDTGTGGG